VPPERIPVGLDDQVALYRSLLAGRRVLVVLDNARDAGQVRPLLPGSPGCLAIVTSRDHLTGLIAGHGAHPLGLDLLTREGARELMARRVGASRASREPDAVDEAGTLDRLGDVHHGAGDARAARWAWTQALRTLDELGHPDSDRVRAKIRVPGDRLPAVI
jgi:hypothetical protein